MADVLNPEQTESKPLNTELETPTLEAATEQSEPSIESTLNPVEHEHHEIPATPVTEASPAQPEAKPSRKPLRILMMTLILPPHSSPLTASRPQKPQPRISMTTSSREP